MTSPRSTWVTLALSGWLWADILVALFVIFAVANTIDAGPIKAAGPSPTPSPSPSPSPPRTPTPTATLPPGVDKDNSVEVTLPVSGQVLLSNNEVAVAEERRRFTQAAKKELDDKGGGRQVAVVLAFGYHGVPANGERLAAVATADFAQTFQGSLVLTYHYLVGGNTGTAVQLKVFFFHKRN